MATPRKVIDIIPPKNFSTKLQAAVLQKEEKKSKPPLKISWVKVLLVMFVLAIVVSICLLHIVFAKATVTIWPDSKEVRLTQRIAVSTEAKEVNEETKYIPGVLVSAQKENTQLFPSTGSQTQATTAQGVIKIFNERSVVQSLIINTRFVSEDGFMFRSTKRNEIPAATTEGGKLVPGSLDVTVVAAESGPNYNIGPSSFSVPGLAGSALYTQIYGKSEQDMFGGSLGNTIVVASKDIEEAGKQLEVTLAARAKTELRSQLPQGFIIPDDGFATEVLESSSLVKPGAAIENFNYTATVEVRAIAFKSSDLEQLSLSLLNSQVGDTETLNSDSVQVSFEVGNFKEAEEVLSLDVTIIAASYALVDTEGMAELIGGKTPFTSEALLKGQEGVARAQINLWPFWLTKVPRNADKINVLLDVD